MITGSMLRDAVVSASAVIAGRRKEVDALNVFPVPDGDTGTNMAMTMGAAAKEVASQPDGADVSAVAEVAAYALLRGARGNSGVILSLIFRGIAKAVKGCSQASAQDFGRALAQGSDTAYKAVMKPTEGTMLTVIRIASERAKEAAAQGRDALDVWDAACESAREALANTPELLPVLKKAGVVDAGGQGLVYIFEAMAASFRKKELTPAEDAGEFGGDLSAVAGADEQAITFTYCTEFIIRRTGKSDAAKLRAYLESIGDSVVVAHDDRIIKVHAHTDLPGEAIQAALAYGKPVDIKIDDMREQHREAAEKNGRPAAGEGSPDSGLKRYGLVVVAAGEGIKELFTELGADRIVSGGQTMNPSTDDILKAVAATPAEFVFVLPNNKNIIMAAEQAVPLAGKPAGVVHTRSIPQGVAAALNLDPELSAEANSLNMHKAAERVATGQVTYAVKDSETESRSIRKGQILGMENGKITVVGASPAQVAYDITARLFKKGFSSLITVFYGKETTQEQARELSAKLEASFGEDAEISLVDGGQPIYYYIIAVE